ncbi:ribonuclease domain-containing protein [Azoarcus olearius]|uniref:Ribonuclease n=1 Tax=Azoarcus sp. (strain BH72) TaxID=418699 RepID=A1KAK1_AZOSB|nr:ribonuclease domain-containing protein [Azoarcus olearius]CAL95857.1 ribonuclease [Azoarcus olearius]
MTRTTALFQRIVAALAIALALAGCYADSEARGSALPPEAVATLQLIARGGPYPYRKDGTVFQNREGRLPAQPRGYYREFTVPTPGSRDRGARRIVTGGDPPAVYYYTEDHYRSFRRIEPAP